MHMTAPLLFIAVLLLVGVILRLRFALFRWLYIPASVLAGLIGLLIVQFVSMAAGQIESGDALSDPGAVAMLDRTLQAWNETLQDWPGFLIAVVFAGMLLERKPSSLHDSASQVGRQGLMVWVIVLGQTAVGLLTTWLIIQPSFAALALPNSLGMLIETGMAGGHGTAAAMGRVYASETIGLESGLDLGILMATCGLVYGVVTGIVWINLAIRWGWVIGPDRTTHAVHASEQSTDVPIGYAKVGSETIDPLLLQVIWLALAVGLGMAMQWSVMSAAEAFDNWFQPATSGEPARDELASRLSATTVLAFPLFIYTLFGGLVVRTLLRIAGHEAAVDRESINRLTAMAMDILVVAAITSLNLTAVASLLVPFSILFIAGAIWSGICLLVISRWILPPNYWFQLGLINYGMSTGTTATGFVLLRVIDPELESGAAEDYALAAPLSSPFIGGGMLTVGLPLLLLERVPIAVSALAISSLVALLTLAGYRWNRPYRNQPPR
jgi:ESS family glutamate:Na+ symporter